MICISIGDIPFEEAKVLARKAGMIELRQDLARYSFPQISELIREARRSLITCRPGPFTDEERIGMFSFALKKGASYIDVEVENDASFIKEVKAFVQQYAGDLIISYHDYEKTPAMQELESIMKHCYGLGGNVAKIATMVNSDADIANLLGLYRKKGRKVVIGMGEKGMITRVASIPLGAEFTFASVSETGETAPGQLTESELHEIYRILKI